MKPYTIGALVFIAAVAAFSVKVKTDVRRAEALQGFQGSISFKGNPPDFALADLDGARVQLEEEISNHQVVLVNFWATWCAPCRLELPQFERLYEQYRDSGLQILAVNVGETEETITDFLDERPMSFPVLLDGDGVVAARYRVNPFPTTIIIDSEGNVADVIEGLNPYLAYRIESLLDAAFEFGTVEY